MSDSQLVERLDPQSPPAVRIRFADTIWEKFDALWAKPGVLTGRSEILTRRLRLAATVVGASALLNAIETFQYYMASLSTGARVTWRVAFQTTFPSWLMFAALAPAILSLAGKFTLERQSRFRSAVVHTVAAITYGFVHLIGVVLIRFMLQPAPGNLVWFVRLDFAGFFPLDVFNYVAVVAIFLAAHYYRQYRDRELAASKLRLKALRAQLDPHFIFNTLNAISALAMTGDQKAVAEMLSRFSDLLRAVLRDGAGDELPLAIEKAFIENYLALQQIRYGDRLKCDLSFAADALDAMVPALILQPLIENAIGHGIGNKTSGGRLQVLATRNGRRLNLEVRDNGPGFPADGPAVGVRLVLEAVLQAPSFVYRTELGTAVGDSAATARVALKPYEIASALRLVPIAGPGRRTSHIPRSCARAGGRIVSGP